MDPGWRKIAQSRMFSKQGVALTGLLNDSCCSTAGMHGSHDTYAIRYIVGCWTGVRELGRLFIGLPRCAHASGVLGIITYELCYEQENEKEIYHQNDTMPTPTPLPASSISPTYYTHFSASVPETPQTSPSSAPAIPSTPDLSAPAPVTPHPQSPGHRGRSGHPPGLAAARGFREPGY